MRPLSLLLPLLLSLFAGCANQEIQRKDGTSSARTFTLSSLAKSDVDIITELNQREIHKSLRLIAEKLYRRNPSEYRKTGFESPEAATERIFEHLANWPESPLAKLNWEDNFKLAFQDAYGGDRVYAFMTALTTMVMASYNHKTAFFLPDEVSAQKLYNSARNIETAVWKLSNARYGGTGGRMLISNSMDGEVQNLSFEREFGKLIAQQDLLALIMEDRGNRSISRVFQNAASFAFLPI
ncbi:MAG: hypothetical protein AB1899_15970 [Pseudomonadota bacterium]